MDPAKEIYVETCKSNFKEQTLKRVIMYIMHILLLQNVKRRPITIWDRESNFERMIYWKLKKWEYRHPIIGIVICTILGGILVSLIAGIILEAVSPLL
jgi:hypothetical protein